MPSLFMFNLCNLPVEHGVKCTASGQSVPVSIALKHEDMFSLGYGQGRNSGSEIISNFTYFHSNY